MFPDPELYPFQSRWFESSAGRLHYVDEGTGPPLVLFHGNPTWSFLYRDIIRALRGRFRCIALDYLGFGLSERPAGFDYTAVSHARVAGELVDALGLDGFVVMGQDWGGPIGLSVAVARAERVRGLVLGNTWFWPSTGSVRAFSHVMSSGVLQDAILRRNFFVRRLMPLACASPLDDAVMEHYRAVQPSAAARVGVARFPLELRESALLPRLAEEVPARLGGLPVLLAWGMKDFAFRASACLPRMRAAFADHVVLELPGASHYLQEDAPGEIAAAIGARFRV